MTMFYQYHLINGQSYVGEDDKLDNDKYPEIKAETVEDFLRRQPLEKLPDAMAIAGDSE